MPDELVSQRDDGAVAKFVERFALALNEAGVPRMPARVFAALMASEQGKLTAGELADALQVSPAAISGAVRYLDQVSLIVKGRDPGERRDHYQLLGDPWFEAVLRRDKVLVRWAEVLDEGADAVGRGTVVGRRLTEGLRFFEFLQAEMKSMIERWQEHEANR